MAYVKPGVYVKEFTKIGLIGLLNNCIVSLGMPGSDPVFIVQTLLGTPIVYLKDKEEVLCC